MLHLFALDEWRKERGSVYQLQDIQIRNHQHLKAMFVFKIFASVCLTSNHYTFRVFFRGGAVYYNISRGTVQPENSTAGCTLFHCGICWGAEKCSHREGRNKSLLPSPVPLLPYMTQKQHLKTLNSVTIQTQPMRGRHCHDRQTLRRLTYGSYKLTYC